MLGQILVVWACAMRRTGRDPHVLLMLAFPLILFPIISFGLLEMITWQTGGPYDVSVEGPPQVIELFADQDDFRHTPPDEAHVIVRGESTEHGWRIDVERQAETKRSELAKDAVVKRLRSVREDALDEMAGANWLPVFSDDLSDSIDEVRLGLLASVLFLVIMAVQTGVYPAVDLTASQRRRATLETSLTTSAPRWVIAAGHLLTVWTWQVVAGTIGFIATFMVVAGAAIPAIKAAIEELGFDLMTVVGFVVPNVVAMVVVLVVVIGASSALFLCSVAAAGSFKTAELAGTGAMMGVMALMMAGASQAVGGEAGVWMWIPIANAGPAFGLRATGEISTLLFSCAVGVNLVTAVVGCLVYARMVGSEGFVIGWQYLKRFES